GAVDPGLAELAEPGEEFLAAPDVLAGGLRMRVDQIQAEAAQEEFLGETGFAPVPFPRVLGHLARFAFGDLGRGLLCGWSGHEGSPRRVVGWVDPAGARAGRGPSAVRTCPVLLVRMYPIP